MFYLGVGNPNDWLFILFSGIIELGKSPDSNVEFEMLPVNTVCEILSNLGFSSSSLSSTIGINFYLFYCYIYWSAYSYPIFFFLINYILDICGNNLVPFKTIINHLDVEMVPFQQWKKILAEKLETPDLPHKKILEGLLLFSGGLPDDREYKKEIMERSRFVSDHFTSVTFTYDESVVKKYLEYIYLHWIRK